MSHDAMAAGRFYERMFDATIEESKGANGLPRCHVKLNDQLILISTVDRSVTQKKVGPHGNLGLDHLGLIVEDMELAEKTLKEKGATFLMKPRYGNATVIAFIQAPDGVNIELIARGN